MDQSALKALEPQQLHAWPVDEIRELHLEMGQQCNVRCSMCYQTDFSPATKMPEIVWRERLLPAYKSATQITLQGGEPTVMKNCRDLLDIVMRDYQQMKLITVTNGVLFKGVWEEAFLQQGSYLNFSLNAIDPDLYAKIVQFGRQETVIGNIDRMVRRKRECGSALVIRTSSVILPETINEIPVFAQWAVEHELEQVLFHTDTSLSQKHPDVQLVQRRISETYDIADRNPQLKMLHLDEFDAFYASTHGIKPVRIIEKKTKAPEVCPVAFNGLMVDYRGFARACCRSWYPYGDLKTESLEAVWNGKAATKFRSRILRKDYRDCLVVCDLNPYPINAKVADLRKAFFVAKKDPGHAVGRLRRKLGISNAQIKK